MFIIFITIVSALYCEVGQYLDQETGTCTPCINNCATCTSAVMCNSCIESADSENPYVMTETYQCVTRPKVDKCISYSGLFCTQCDIHYYLALPDCKTCGDNCNYCNSQECFQCASGYTLVKNGKACIDCSLPENDAECGRCPSDKYFDVKSFTCMSCKDFCSMCSTATNCLSCSTGYALKDPTNSESPCVKIENCAEGFTYGDHCERCNPSYYLSDGKCAKCGTDCAECIDVDTCTTCINSKKLAQGTCVDSIPHCFRSDNVNGCTACDEGYYIGEGSICTQCGETCSTCMSKDYCFRCAKNYYFDNTVSGKCLLKEDNCVETDQYGCLECKYNQVNNEQCARDGIKDCIQQRYGYYLEATIQADGTVVKYTQKCQQCNSNCRICSYNKDWCTACNDGYALVERIDQKEAYRKITGQIGSVYYCEVKPASCKRTEMGYCVECVDGYFLSDVSCINCDVSCGSCTTSTYCVTCSAAKDSDGKNIYWRPSELTEKEGEEKGYCMKIADTSADYGLSSCAHNSTNMGCTQCKEGYYLHNNYCRSCPLDRCFNCKETGEMNGTVPSIACTGCNNNTYLDESLNRCISCDKIDKCTECQSDGCYSCSDGYTPSPNRKECTKINLALIIPLSVVGLVVIIAIIIAIIVLIWLRLRSGEKEEKKTIRPTKVSSDIEMSLAKADNANFRLQASTWDLDFGHKGDKLKVGETYKQVVKLVNLSKTAYFYEITATPHHTFELDINPKRQTLKPSYAIDVTFTIKPLCTAFIQQDVAIVAMGMDQEENGQAAKFGMKLDTDVSIYIDYEELKSNAAPIGEGAFSMVFRGKYRGEDVAVKQMKEKKFTQEQKEAFDREVARLHSLRYDVIIRLVGAVYTEEHLAIVTSFAEFGTLSKFHEKQGFPLVLKEKILDDLAAAIHILHNNHIIHRDIKGDNVLIFSIEPRASVCAKLSDFGTTRDITEKSLKEHELTRGIGTPNYMPPECLQRLSYGLPMDVFAFGVVMYETFVEHGAYDNDPRFTQPWNIPQFISEGNRLDKPDLVPDYYWKLLTSCWSQKEEDRPDIDAVFEAINKFPSNFQKISLESVFKPIAQKEFKRVDQQESEESDEQSIPDEKEKEQVHKEEDVDESSSSSSDDDYEDEDY
ncbi:serine-threonine protein kinase, putative [Entamoeba invadens IP1]|uniref:Serine-threonine protein kinase, putative n=1 Tax=Entamoeba invadens IP1 TaxID=370355 RepID=A0A0A1TXY5_ENTIV|nr:serine-threonine protein kinase, putative [Entamoeba invadens IP1]ELP86252.1 serine-threonine protein kinase, putative [Entamoeba invadens IP1]|eukprot:XP_004185598.1 serine-threonine protein kinase, putative [Entamoeba invadens IP1]